MQKPLHEDLRLFSYKQEHDFGFAPNPFHGHCTLATCKPLMRQSKRVGDWIAGFSSRKLNGDEIGYERLIYLMQVTEKMMFNRYFEDPRFIAKIPSPGSKLNIETVGDNIYGVRGGQVFQVPNHIHGVEEIGKDTGGQFVLISDVFAYFGSKPLAIPDELRPAVPAGQAGQGHRTHDQVCARAFIDFVLAHGQGVHAQPTEWDENDKPCRQKSSCE